MKIFRSGILIVLSLIPFLQSCESWNRDDNGILLFEHLEKRRSERWDVVHSSLWIPIKKYGPPIMYYQDELYSGEIIQYYQNGNVEFHGFYEDGAKNGIWTSYWENGNKKSIEDFWKRKPIGDWFEFDENGILIHHEFKANKDSLFFR